MAVAANFHKSRDRYHCKKGKKKGELKEIAFGFVRVQKSGSVRSSRFGAPPPATAGGWIAHKDSQDTSTNSSQSNFGLY